jgi:hypothetical protein
MKIALPLITLLVIQGLAFAWAMHAKASNEDSRGHHLVALNYFFADGWPRPHGTVFLWDNDHVYDG